MGKYFSIEELSASSTARSHGIDNTPPEDAIANMQALITKLLDPLRAEWGHSIRVNSGYRSAQLNRAVGGAAQSQHMRGEAADLTTGSRSDNRKLFNLIRECGLEFDQLINEHDYSWIHVSYSVRHNRRQVIV